MGVVHTGMQNTEEDESGGSHIQGQPTYSIDLGILVHVYL